MTNYKNKRRMKELMSGEREEHRDKRLKMSRKSQVFLCSMERYWDRLNQRPPPAKAQPWNASYIIRSINLSDLLTSRRKKLEFREIARMDDSHLPSSPTKERVGLPGYIGCGVIGTKIVFASGMEPNFDRVRSTLPFRQVFSKHAYAFDTLDPAKGIVDMRGQDLIGGKCSPLMFEFFGKLYVLSYKWLSENSFEVFDPQLGTWSVLPHYPDAGRCVPVLDASYVIAGTKLFISTANCSICCFDFASPQPEWRRVPTLCHGGPLPFTGRAVAVDLPQAQHSNKKLLFSGVPSYKLLFSGVPSYTRSGIMVHLMTIDENNETISRIFNVDLPAELPHQPVLNDCHFFHLGEDTVFLVITAPGDSPTKSGVYTVATLPLKSEFDISKVDKDIKNCFGLKFEPPCVVRYRSSPDSVSTPVTVGCFLF